MQHVIIILASLGVVVVGSLVILAVMFAMTRRRRQPVPRASSARTALNEEPGGSVIVSSDYEAQARPERIDATPVTVEDPSDSFAEIFVEEAAPPRTYSSPLPMPVPPPDLEPIPEHEPTQLFARRPDWATDW